ncbi:hypothetical protein BO94DRAFT_224334 [Aspergillus sclerotioniger CBS 115572]|uniref:DUF2293 domain-containing protein n=1 Tax=Aspergillus sclerotioniger CBS 115572 TaxID=1450535 RepID=A0A317XAU3_9EURO|nr:hypothetical protein BO94DRAFT_224334 [Aspergillus sclerotioniger CBS 115572]PWY95301.1 hypothetical protein BO94DRAFT_224334 [Aspergillus sclerotioniger CBS 115572]
MSRTPKKGSRSGAARRINRGKKILGRSAITPRSPRSILAQARRNSLLKKRDRGDLAGVATSNKTKPVERGSPKVGRYARLSILPPSTEPQEKNCFKREVSPAHYVFVPKGDVYITRHCRIKTKESGQIVYVVYDNRGKTTLGLRVPADVHAAVLQSAAETAKSRAHAVKLRDEKYSGRARELLRTHFPLMPEESLDTVLQHAFLKGTGRVGRVSNLSDERKANLAVEAHIRHTHTRYESLLKAGKARDQARNATRGVVQAIKSTWAGGRVESTDCLTVRNRL